MNTAILDARQDSVHEPGTAFRSARAVRVYPPLFALGILHAGRDGLHLACSCHVEWLPDGQWLRTAGVHCHEHNPRPGRMAAGVGDQPVEAAR